MIKKAMCVALICMLWVCNVNVAPAQASSNATLDVTARLRTAAVNFVSITNLCEEVNAEVAMKVFKEKPTVVNLDPSATHFWYDVENKVVRITNRGECDKVFVYATALEGK